MSAATMEQRPQHHQRQRSKSTFSFKSDHSQNSHSKQLDKHHTRESAEEKRRTHLTPQTKADPNAAMNESQPIAAALEKPTLQSLRSFQHTDTNGVIISEPDLSNPTRSRWERPLDTIRSFEAAIDGEYKRRSQAVRGDSSEMLSGYASRRSSYYGGHDQNRQSQAGGYYGGRQAARDRESWADGGYAPPMGQRNRYNRQQTDPYRYGQGLPHSNNIYPNPPYQQSRDTINTGLSGGSNSDPYSNDHSENSSIDHRGGPVQPMSRQDQGEQYGYSGYNGGGGPQPIMEEYGNGYGPQSNNGHFPPPQPPPHGSNNAPPPVPSKVNAPPPNNPNVIKLSQTASNGQGGPQPGRPNVLSRKGTSDSGGKRQSWFKKRFSKN